MKKESEGKMLVNEREEEMGKVKSTSVLRLREEVVEVEKRSKASPGEVEIDFRLILSIDDEDGAGASESEEESELESIENVTSRSFMMSCSKQFRFGFPFPMNFRESISPSKTETSVDDSANPFSRISPTPLLKTPSSTFKFASFVPSLVWASKVTGGRVIVIGSIDGNSNEIRGEILTLFEVFFDIVTSERNTRRSSWYPFAILSSFSL
mmetsp:Transcript_10377/g.21362  ORF Transcript_10377/g.21362 Transcript_10377/m.21362 type:complete len:210 (+) Transcript_10377:4676-5305(+)